MTGSVARLAELGLELPKTATPLGAYVPAVRSGQHVYVSGQLPLIDGELRTTGKVGAEVSPEDARESGHKHDVTHRVSGLRD